ncbi:MAG: hypothetical protein ACR2HF_12350 [Methylococcaceae bacterium]
MKQHYVYYDYDHPTPRAMTVPISDEETEVIVVINDNYYSGFDKMIYQSLQALGLLIMFAMSMTLMYQVIQHLLR